MRAHTTRSFLNMSRGGGILNIEWKISDGLIMDFTTAATPPATVPSYLLHKNTGLRSVVGVTCAFSIVGSFLIVLAYILLRDLRTSARLILVHVSLADFGVGVSNLFGEILQLDGHYSCTLNRLTRYKGLCEAQAFVAHFSTLSSVLWTMVLSAFMYTLIVNRSTTKWILRLSYLFCYGFPLFITIWLLCTNRLGFSPYNSSGWCAMIALNFSTKPDCSPYKHPSHDYTAIIFGYDLWIVMTSVFIIIVYLSLLIYIKQEKARSEEFQQYIHNVDYKFIAIPFAFVLLRIWSVIENVLFIYADIPLRHLNKPLLNLLQYLAGIGDSGQGAVNAVLFILFTHNVRQRIVSFWCRCCVKRSDQTAEKIESMHSKPCLIGSDDGFASASYASSRATHPVSIDSRKIQKGKQGSISLASTTSISPSLNSYY